MDEIKEKLVFEGPKESYKGFTVKAWYLKDSADALVEIYKGDVMTREFLFPAYKIWNISAHFEDIVDGELENSDKGYRMAAWTGIN